MGYKESAKQQATRRLMEERKFTWRLKRLFRRLINSLPKTEDPLEFVRELKKAANSKIFLKECEKLAMSMTNFVAAGQYRTWREAAAASNKGRTIYQLLRKETSKTAFIGRTVRDIVRSNADLIKTCPLSMAQDLTDMIRERVLEGERPETILPEVMAKARHLTDVQARRIARTESSKANSALREARARQYNRAFYIWWTCSDERVRSSHDYMHLL